MVKMDDSQQQQAQEVSQQDFFSRYGGSAPENYERYFVPVIGAPHATDLIKRAGLRAGERVLDVACGTGVVARGVADLVGATGFVAGVDINPGMLGVARGATPSGMAIQWYEARAEALPLADESFDVVFCQLSLQFFQDKVAALREMRRVLAPGGRLLINVPGSLPPPFAIMEDVLARYSTPESAAFVSAVFSLRDHGEMQRLMRDAGFRDVVVQTNSLPLPLPAPRDFLWQYIYSTPLGGVVEQLDSERRAALERDVVTKWQEFVQDGTFTLRLDPIVATALK